MGQGPSIDLHSEDSIWSRLVRKVGLQINCQYLNLTINDQRIHIKLSSHPEDKLGQIVFERICFDDKKTESVNPKLNQIRF